MRERRTPRYSTRGSLTEESLAEVLGKLSREGKSGILHLSRDGVSKRIYLKTGAIQFAGSDDPDERLGQFLLRAGTIKRHEIDQALKELRGTGQTFAKTVVEMGLVPEDEMELRAEERTKSVIGSLLTWRSGEYGFEDRDPEVDESIALKTSTADLIFESVRDIGDTQAVRRGLGDLKRVPRQSDKDPSTFENGSLSSSMNWILHQANGDSPIEDIVRRSPLGEEKTLQSLYALVSAGVLQLDDPYPEVKAIQKTDESGEEALELEDFFPQEISVASFPRHLGRYEVREVLGRGAMGAVLLARDPAIDRLVAIKLIQTAVHLNASTLEKYRERFQREARAAGKLLHPGIVTVFDVGHAESEIPFIVLEYVEGNTLDRILDTVQPRREDTARWATEILDALQFAHSYGIVHRDIKPANLIVTADGHVKITDFGIAHVVGSQLTGAGEKLGTPYYMAPEQITKDSVDQRTDLFSFGVVLYEILTGKMPFQADSLPAMTHAILTEDPTPPEDIQSELSPALGRIVLRCLAKNPEERFQSAKEVQEALGSLDDDEWPKTAPNTLKTQRASLADTRRTAAPVSSLLGGSKKAWLGASVLVLAALLVTLSLIFKKDVEPPQGESKDANAVTNDAEQQPSERRRPETSQTKPDEQEPSVPAEEPLPIAEPELFRQASVALENGDLELGQAKVKTLLRRNPEFPGASQLAGEIEVQVWKESLPLSFSVQHDHRIGQCTGTLSLETWGIRYRSEEHEWSWSFDQIQIMERQDQKTLTLATYEKDVIRAGKPKSYNFILENDLTEEQWQLYRKLAE